MAASNTTTPVDLSMSPWKEGWLARSSTLFTRYNAITSMGLSLSILYYAVQSFRHMRRTSKELTLNPSSRAVLHAETARHMRKTSKRHYYVATLYLVNCVVIAMIDGGIALDTILVDVAVNPTRWTAEFGLALAIHSVTIFAFMMACVTLVPALQLALLARILSRYKRSLASCLPEARVITTHTAQLWAMASFYIISFSPPLSSAHPYVRWGLLLSAYGSAGAWLHASHAFNFCSDTFEEEAELVLVEPGVKAIVLMFRRTVWVEKTAEEVLPVYEEAVLPEYEDVASVEPAREERR